MFEVSIFVKRLFVGPGYPLAAAPDIKFRIITSDLGHGYRKWIRQYTRVSSQCPKKRSQTAAAPIKAIGSLLAKTMVICIREFW